MMTDELLSTIAAALVVAVLIIALLAAAGLAGALAGWCMDGPVCR